MKTIIITGATSFIATNLIESLDKSIYKIFAVVRKNSKNLYKLSNFKNVTIVELNLEEIQQLPNYIHQECDAFFHFAWNGTRGSTRDDEKLQNNNVEYSMDALIASQKLGCHTFFTAGSQAEYGIQDSLINENSPCNPVTEYGKAKFAFYEKAKKYCKENNIRLFEPRFFSIYGPDDFPQTLVASTLKKLVKNDKVECSSGKQLWNFIYIKDAVNVLIKLLESNLPSGVFNVAGDETKELKKYILEMKSICNSKSDIIFNDFTPSGINPDITKIKKLLNFENHYTFADGIKEILKSMEVI